MKILYAIQGTGNGHIARAIEILPFLRKYGKVDILISSSQFNLDLPFSANFRLRGMYYVFGKHGGIDIYRTILNFNPLKLLDEIKRFPIQEYDLIISDFEPISSWAAKIAGMPCIGIGNVVATLHPLAPRPLKKSLLGKMILNYYCPTTANYGLHFKSLGPKMYTPIIRNSIRKLSVSDAEHYTVYLPAYKDKFIVDYISRLGNIKWEIFSRFIRTRVEMKNMKIIPINDELFGRSIASSSGVICNAGFGVASEALFLEKKLITLPMKRQYEQYCNAAMLETMGVSILNNLNSSSEKKMLNWIEHGKPIKVNYPDQTEEIINNIIKENS